MPKKKKKKCRKKTNRPFVRSNSAGQRFAPRWHRSRRWPAFVLACEPRLRPKEIRVTSAEAVTEKDSSIPKVIHLSVCIIGKKKKKLKQ